MGKQSFDWKLLVVQYLAGKHNFLNPNGYLYDHLEDFYVL
jgi:hypothetical protein